MSNSNRETLVGVLLSYSITLNSLYWMIRRNSFTSLADIFILLKSSSPLAFSFANRAYLVSFFRAHLRLSLRVLGSYQQVWCWEDSPATGHTAYARDVSNFGKGQVISDGFVLPYVGFLTGILPWGCLVTLVRERDRLFTRGRLEAPGLLGGSISGEMDHQWFGLARAFVSRLHAHMLLPLACVTNFKLALVHYPL